MNTFVVRYDGTLIGSYQANDEDDALDAAAQDASQWTAPAKDFKGLRDSMKVTRDQFTVEKVEV